MRKKSKMEVESLRSRFRMMQTTATLERSPSVSESELSFEVHHKSYHCFIVFVMTTLRFQNGLSGEIDQ